MSNYYATLKERSADELQTLLDDDDRLRRAFAALELHARMDNAPNRSRALRLFADAIKRDTANGWAFLGYGLAISRINGNTVYRTLRIHPSAVYAVAEASLRRALKLDPGLPEARQALVSISATASNVTRDGVESSAAAASAGREYLHRATSHFRNGETTEGATAYWQGMDVWDEAAASAYVYDVAMITAEDELVALTDGTLQKRKASFEHFWKKRALRSGITMGDRIAEHYRRLDYARRNFAMDFGINTIGTNVFGGRRKGVEREIDDRGLIYIRYGDPELRSIIQPLSARSEAWGYRQPNGRITPYFFAGGRIIADPLPVFGPVALEAFDPRYAFVAARAQTAHTYAFMKKAGADTRVGIANAYEDASRQNDRIVYDNRVRLFNAFYADAAKPYFKKNVSVFHDFAAFRGNGCTDVVFGLAVPAPAFRATLAIADTFSWEAQSVDTLVSHTENGLAQSDGIICTLPDYNAYVRFTVTVDSTSGGAAGQELHVADFAGKSLIMSDLLFAFERAGSFARGNAQLALAPARTFRQQEPFKVYYELYNLPRGRKYRTDITFTTLESNPLARLFKGKSKTTVTFEGESNSDDVVTELRTLVPEVEPGKVQVRIDITDLTTMETTSATKFVWIVGPAK